MEYRGVYESISFPPYQFKEYPKWVRWADATGQPKETLVQTQRDELALLAETPEAAQNDPVVVEKNKLGQSLQAAQDREAKLELELAELKARLAQMESPNPEVVTVQLGAKAPAKAEAKADIAKAEVPDYSKPLDLSQKLKK